MSGQPLETVLTIDNAPVQATDRFILTTASACIVDDVNIGQFRTEYAYDALGRRIEKRAGGEATRYVYDGARVAEEWTVPDGGSPSLAASYVYGLYIDEVLTMRRGGSDYYYHSDDMHNVVKLTDSDGDVVEAYDYGDYGQPEFYDASGVLLDATASAFGNPFLFSGREWDEELGFYYFRNRYMDPGLGRFVSRDPLGLWGDPLNLGNGYTYAASNPWSLVDPFGLCSGNQSPLPRWGERSYLEESLAVAKDYFWDPTVGAATGIGKAVANYDEWEAVPPLQGSMTRGPFPRALPWAVLRWPFGPKIGKPRVKCGVVTRSIRYRRVTTYTSRPKKHSRDGRATFFGLAYRLALLSFRPEGAQQHSPGQRPGDNDKEKSQP